MHKALSSVPSTGRERKRGSGRRKGGKEERMGGRKGGKRKGGGRDKGERREAASSSVSFKAALGS